MTEQDAPLQITGADFTPESLFVTFSNGVSVTYSVSFLFATRKEDNNAVIATERDLPSRDSAKSRLYHEREDNVG